MKFAKGLCKEKYLFIFIIGSLIGTIYEDLLQGLRNLITTGIFSFDMHRGVIYGPFNVIYGFGAVIMLMYFVKRKKTTLQIIFEGALIGGIFEFFSSFLQEKFLGTVAWDYSNEILNIDGRTTIPIMAIWGLMCLFLIKVIYPFLSKIIEKIPKKVGEPLYKYLLIFMILDISISWSAIIRQSLRHEGIKPFTLIGEIYDYVYNDEVLKKYFPNTKIK